jgi:hypothetical protein
MNISGLPGPVVSVDIVFVLVQLASTLSSFTTTGLTTVFGPSTVTAYHSGWNTITFATPYNWDGTSNIIVDIRVNGAYGMRMLPLSFLLLLETLVYMLIPIRVLPITFYTSSPYHRNIPVQYKIYGNLSLL